MGTMSKRRSGLNKDMNPVPIGDTSFEKVSETTTKKRNGSSKDSIPVPTNDTSFERVRLSETITNKRGESKRMGTKQEMNPVPTNDTPFERVKLSETMTKRRGRGVESKPEPTQPKAKPKKSAPSSLDQQKDSNPALSGSPVPLKPKQMSIMAFVQKKKEEALEKRVSGYLSPASEASLEEDEISKPNGDSNPKPSKEVKS